MEENRYRESRLCRVLGNPLAYSLVCSLIENGPKGPSEIAAALGRSTATVSHALGKLRLAELVRFDRSGRTARYRVKYPKETAGLIRALEIFERATLHGK